MNYHDALQGSKSTMVKLLGEAHDGTASSFISCVLDIKSCSSETTIADVINCFRDGTGKNSLHFAALSGNLETARVMLEYDYVDIDIKDDSGDTPAALAVRSNNQDVLLLLKYRGSSFLDSLNNKQYSLLHLAAENFDTTILGDLLSFLRGGEGEGKDVVNSISTSGTALQIAVTRGNVPGVKKLLEYKDTNPNAHGEGIPPPLLLAASMRLSASFAFHIFDLLLNHADINVNVVDEKGWTVLHCLAENGDVQGAKRVLQMGANPNVITLGQTALELAKGYKEFEELLKPLTTVDTSANKAKSNLNSTTESCTKGMGEKELIQHKPRITAKLGGIEIDATEELKTRGNELFNEGGHYVEAKKVYEQGIALIDSNHELAPISDCSNPLETTTALSPSSTGIDPRARRLLAVLLSNVSACAFQLSEFSEAEEYANRAIQVDSEWFKGHYRLGQAFKAQGKMTDAATSLGAAFVKNPTSNSLRIEFQQTFAEAKKMHAIQLQQAKSAGGVASSSGGDAA